MPITAGQLVSKRQDIQGGDACIHGTRIPVWVLVNYRRLGGSDADVLAAYPSLKTEDLKCAWEYYASHRDEIECAIQEDEEV
jgi:uncharacterized protein (DUF433 family)